MIPGFRKASSGLQFCRISADLIRVLFTPDFNYRTCSVGRRPNNCRRDLKLQNGLSIVISTDRLCENTVHGSTKAHHERCSLIRSRVLIRSP